MSIWGHGSTYWRIHLMVSVCWNGKCRSDVDQYEDFIVGQWLKMQVSLFQLFQDRCSSDEYLIGSIDDDHYYLYVNMCSNHTVIIIFFLARIIIIQTKYNKQTTCSTLWSPLSFLFSIWNILNLIQSFVQFN